VRLVSGERLPSDVLLTVYLRGLLKGGAVKKKIKRMTLSKETLRNLEEAELHEPVGGTARTECGSCPAQTICYCSRVNC
jgi:hypothetical protein